MQTGNPVNLVVITGDNVPSFKNTKRSILDKNTGHQRTLTPAKIKKRMTLLENRILFALFSACQTKEGATDSECLKQLRTVLCGLSDDSLKEIHEFSFGYKYVENHLAGVEITITKL